MKNSTTTTATIEALKKIFTIEGLPETLVSDNGPQFASSDFTNFCKKNGIQYLGTAPFQPASNGEAERFVRTFKNHFKKIFNENPNKDIALFQCLSTYCTTPNPKTGKSPAELLYGRLIPEHHSNTTTTSSQTLPNKFKTNEAVYARNFAKGHRWIEATIIKPIGTKMYLVKTNRGLWKCHQNQLKLRSEATDS
ncbi:uncharacterized protein K02A2.6-like [Eupeodes corollae]|uniref:uncharacterized protein K02A2.6-like n=1 Tax=Eupeodes corollae TaxID=290404 RepID=UPI00248F9C7A|nr:uncharacterized protein K02A2.6-like [Eupeodes corollae]